MKRFGFIFLSLALEILAAGPVVESNLPVIHLQVAKQIGSEPKVPCSVRMVPPNGLELGNTGALAGLIRYHGASSQGYDKKSFAFTLDSPTRWMGLNERRQWVLNAAFVDCSMMRHKLSYDLFQSMSADGAKRFASSSRFVEVNLNGRYHGAYLLMERVDRALLGLLRYDSNAPNQAVIYKAVDHSGNFSDLGHGGYEQREPEPEVRQYWGPLDDLNLFTSRAPDSKFFDPESGVASRFDIDNVIDFHLLVLFTSNMDGIDKNFILARDAPTAAVPKPKFFFAPWDYDATFGRNWEGSRVGPTEWISSHLFDRLLSNASYRQRYRERWRQLRERQFSVERVTRMIDDNSGTLGDAAKRNERRWKGVDGPGPGQLSFTEDVKQMKEWVAARTTWLDEEIARRTGR